MLRRPAGSSVRQTPWWRQRKPCCQQPPRHAQSAQGAHHTPALLEGYAGAKVLTEGLRRAAAARDLTRGGLQRALDGMSRYDLGGLELSFSPSDHTGLDYADLSIIGADGKFRR